MNKQVFIINGSGGTGKDTFVSLVSESIPTMNFSSVDKVKEVVNKRCFQSMSESCKIVPAGLGSDAGVIGAVALAILESKNNDII